MDYHVKPDVYQANKDAIERLGLQVIHVKQDDEEFYILRNPSEIKDKFSPLDPEEQVNKKEGKTYLKETRIEVIGRAEKMSKSRGNVINPDDVVQQYGADTLRLYEMFMGPLEAVKPWDMRGVEGPYRFLGRVWRLIVDDRADTTKLNDSVKESEPDRETVRQMHRTIQRVTEDLEGMRFNTAIAALMEFSTFLTALPVRPKSVLETLVLLLSPMAPHIGEELWEVLGHKQTLAYEPWPKFDPALARADEIEVPVQVNGKLKARLTVAAEIEEDALRRTALEDARIKEQIKGKQVKKVIVVPRKLVNIVVG